MGMSKNLISQEEFASMDNLVQEKMMLGVDLEEPDEETRKKNMNEEELSNFEATKERVKYEIQDVLDFGGYHLGNEGLQAIIPLLCQDYLLNIKSLDLSYNNLNDNGLDVLI